MASSTREVRNSTNCASAETSTSISGRIARKRLKRGTSQQAAKPGSALTTNSISTGVAVASSTASAMASKLPDSRDSNRAPGSVRRTAR